MGPRVIVPGTVVRSGASAPANGLGHDDDLYLNEGNGGFYKRVSGVYVPIVVKPKTTTSRWSDGPPSSPGDGDIWYATHVDGSNSISRWQFQYDANWTGDAYKWAALGSQRAHFGSNTNPLSTTSASGQALSGGPTYTIQRSGVYIAGNGCYLTTASIPGVIGTFSVGLGNAQLTPGLQGANSTNYLFTGEATGPIGLTSGQVINLWGAINGGANLVVYNAYLFISPARII